MILFQDIYPLNLLNDMERATPWGRVNKLPFPRTNFMKKSKNSFSYSGAVIWNSLPRDMREAKSLSQFKRLAYLNF